MLLFKWWGAQQYDNWCIIFYMIRIKFFCFCILCLHLLLAQLNLIFLPSSFYICQYGSPRKQQLIFWEINIISFKRRLKVNKLRNNRKLWEFQSTPKNEYKSDVTLTSFLLITLLALELEEKCNSQKEDLFAIKILAVTFFV